jgi:diadenosine tetraphosphatase ApaH/serine/threonine PP2A family protein phosphatase
VVDRVRAVGAAVIRGNTDAFFDADGETPDGKEPGRFAAHLSWMMEQLGPERVAFLRGLPFSHRVTPAQGQDLVVVHANPQNLEEAILPRASEGDLDELLLEDGRLPTWRALAFGHLHTPFMRLWRDRLLVNVSSVGLPMDGDRRAAYAILTWEPMGRADGVWRAEHRRVFYPTAVVVQEMRNCGLPRGKHFADRLIAASYSGLD